MSACGRIVTRTAQASIQANKWRVLAEKMEVKRLLADIDRLSSEKECYEKARDIYKLLERHDRRMKQLKET